MDRSEGRYTAEERVTIAEAPGLRVRQLSLAAGQCVPWHYHSRIADTFFCMRGAVCVRTRAPESETVLQPGETFTVPAGRPHTVAGLAGAACRFLIVQGVGEYDYIAVDEPSGE